MCIVIVECQVGKCRTVSIARIGYIIPVPEIRALFRKFRRSAGCNQISDEMAL